jgi:hypothetical protein
MVGIASIVFGGINVVLIALVPVAFNVEPIPDSVIEGRTSMMILQTALGFWRSSRIGTGPLYHSRALAQLDHLEAGIHLHGGDFLVGAAGHQQAPRRSARPRRDELS